MKKGLSEIIIVLDRSGSMEKIRKDMIGGINAFLCDQREKNMNCKVSHYQFDDQWNKDLLTVLFEQKDLSSISELTEKDFVPRGGTPLYDAVATVIQKVGERLSGIVEDERPEKVLFVIITDGEENASNEWTSNQIKQMIEHQTEKYRWEFVYIGANQNAWSVGETIGVKGKSTLGYVASSGGANAMFRSLSNQSATYLSSTDSFSFDENDQKIQEDLGYKP